MYLKVHFLHGAVVGPDGGVVVFVAIEVVVSGGGPGTSRIKELLLINLFSINISCKIKVVI